jgi:hypothetical protein
MGFQVSMPSPWALPSVDIPSWAGVRFVMEPAATIALVVGLFSLTFMLNLPMGFFRRKTAKFSLSWFFCIHAPIPVIYVGRLFAGLDVFFIPVFLVAAVLGQVWGGRLDI